MDIDVRLATAQDRSLIEEFYVREGKNFQQLIQYAATTPVGASSETMFVIAVTRGMVVAALKLDIAKDPAVGRLGFIRYFEIEDALEGTSLGLKMLEKTHEIAEEKGLRALDAVFDVARADLFDLYTESGFREERKEVCLRKDFRPGVFE
jgi:N-acetylglutamate synthase-like GNAT family acetyltransferase